MTVANAGLGPAWEAVSEAASGGVPNVAVWAVDRASSEFAFQAAPGSVSNAVSLAASGCKADGAGPVCTNAFASWLLCLMLTD